MKFQDSWFTNKNPYYSLLGLTAELLAEYNQIRVTLDTALGIESPQGASWLAKILICFVGECGLHTTSSGTVKV